MRTYVYLSRNERPHNRKEMREHQHIPTYEEFLINLQNVEILIGDIHLKHFRAAVTSDNYVSIIKLYELTQHQQVLSSTPNVSLFLYPVTFVMPGQALINF